MCHTSKLAICKKCGFVANADVNGAINILKSSPKSSPRILRIRE
ncbi:hypothetical protein DRO30_03215 [Candidatus Bathyarchaeota archaeon]|nr:MAG: hypothetical protein DRO30_03215 [Candidatus Bathyarchaeota archaeon]